MSSRQIWRETAALFWQYPVLWLPVLGADLLSFVLNRLGKSAARRVIYHLLMGPASVFGDTRSLPGPSSGVPFGKAAALGGIFEWSAHFTQVLLYTTAFLITAVLVQKISRAEPFQSSIQIVRLRWRAILGLSLRLLGLLAILAISLATMLSVVAQSRKFVSLIPSETMYAIGVAAFCAIAYSVAPTAMRRIRTSDLRPLTVESKQNSRIFAVLAVVASSLLGYCMSYVERSFAAEPLFNSALAATALDAIVSLAGAVPYITLFIALTIIVNHDGATAD